eukprot:scaffold8428_cov120-Skeletonema_dohrnii-CCMP3373.AAC.1
MMTSAEVAEVGVASGCDDDLERCICPRETICATDTISIILLTLARCSAFFDYPLYMMLFLSKAHNLNNHMRRTLFREWIDFGDMHTVHKIFGIVVGIETMFHSFFHLLRWGLNNEMSLLWRTAAGITGFIAAAVTPLLCWPMVVPFLKQRLSFELRKGLHYLSIVWAIALLFHAPSKIPWLIGIPALVYVVDFIFGYFKRNNLVETAYFERYGENGVSLHFKNPKSWENRSPTSYVYIMCPWISKYEWHAFTMFPEPFKENHSMLCIGASGDWTKQLYDKIEVPCLRQLYVHGPYMTEFSDKAITTSNAIAVATGVGITPTLSLMMNYAGRKRINIIWVCRDPGLIEYILHKVDISAITRNSYAFIFYTGQRELSLPKHLPVNIFIFRSRPNLENTITGIVTAIHSGEGLPEEMYEKQEKISNAPFRKRVMIAMYRVTQIYDENEMFDFAVKETESAAERMQDVDLESGSTSDSDSDSEEYGSLTVNPQRSSRLLLLNPPHDAVSLLGFDAMISRFLGGIGEYSESDVEDIFHTIDRSRTGFINRTEFSDFLNTATRKNVMNRVSSRDLLSSMVALTDMTAVTNSMHNPNSPDRGSSSHHANTSHGSVFGDSNTIEYMNNLMNASCSTGEEPLEDWSLFYCGGSTGIKNDLKGISWRYKIDLAVENFDW